MIAMSIMIVIETVIAMSIVIETVTAIIATITKKPGIITNGTRVKNGLGTAIGRISTTPTSIGIALTSINGMPIGTGATATRIPLSSISISAKAQNALNAACSFW
jgi:hypothetical protein